MSLQLTLDLRNRLLGVLCLGGATVIPSKTTLGFVQPNLVDVFIVSRFQALNQSKS